MVNPNRDEIIFAESIERCYLEQIASGAEEAILPESLAETGYGLGGIWRAELAQRGLKLGTYSLSGPTYIETIPEGEQDG